MQVQLQGTGFSADPAANEVAFNGTAAQVIAATDVQLTVNVPASASSGPISVKTGGGTVVSSASFQVLTLNPAPEAGSVAPTSVSVGLEAQLAITGSGFIAASVVKLDGTPLPTAFLSGTSLSATLAAGSLTSAGSHQLVVENPAPGGGTSAALALLATNPVPSLSAVTPSSTLVGSASTAVTLSGSGFVQGSVAKLDGAVMQTTFTSSTQLAVTLSVADLAVAGTRNISVESPAPGGGSASSLAFQVLNPVPVLASISPASVPAGAPAFTLSLAGSGFVPGATVRLDGTAVNTTFLSSTSLSADLPAPPFASAGTHAITVENPAPGGGPSGPATLTAQASAAPFISGLSPSEAEAGVAFQLAVQGLNFNCNGVGAKVLVGGSMLAPSSCSATSLVVAVSPLAAGNVTIQVQNQGNSVSNTVNLPVVASNPVPTISVLNPASAVAGTSSLTLNVTGTGFTQGATVSFDGVSRLTTVASTSSLSAVIPSSSLAAAGTYPVVVTNPSPGGGPSTAATFTVTGANPVPVLASLSPASVNAGASAPTLTLTGSGFIATSQALFSGNARSTTFVSATTLQVSLLASDVSAAGTYPVTVSNPLPGGGTSAAVSLAVSAVNPVPAVSNLNPASVTAGSGAQTLTVVGTGFVPASQVLVGGSARTTTYVSATTLTAALTAQDVSSAGSLSLTVSNPTPGGGTSGAVTFTVDAVVQSNPVPTITGLAPCGVVAGSGTQQVTLAGTGFVPGSTVTVGGTSVSVAVNGSASITATIPGTLVASAPSGNTLSVVVTNPAPGGGASSAATFGVASATSTLAATVQPIFTANCVSCHGSGNPSGGLDLSAANARAELLNTSATQACGGGAYVVSCQPSRQASPLIDKLYSTPKCGSRMPKSGPLSATDIQKIIDWVAQGAPQ